MNHRGSWAAVAILALTLTGCAAAGGETLTESDPAVALPSDTAAPSDTSAPEPDETIAPAGDDDGSDEADPDETGEDGGTDAPPPMAVDVDLATPSIQVWPITKDVTVRTQSGAIVQISPRVFAVDTTDPSAPVVKTNVIYTDKQGYYEDGFQQWLVAGTWAPVPGCGATVPDVSVSSSVDMAMGPLYAGQGGRIKTRFPSTTSGPWYFVVGVGSPTCAVAAWAVPVTGADR